MRAPREFLAILVALGLISACSREKPTVGETKQSPDVQGIEGHGGIAIADPAPTLPPSTKTETPPLVEPPPRPAATLCDGVPVPDLYLRAYTRQAAGNPGEAIPEFERVVACAPAGSEYHQKALRKLEELRALPLAPR